MSRDRLCLDESCSLHPAESRKFRNFARRSPWQEAGWNAAQLVDSILRRRAFYFQQRTSKLDMRAIGRVDIERVIKEVDIDTLQVSAIRFGAVTGLGSGVRPRPCSATSRQSDDLDHVSRQNGEKLRRGTTASLNALWATMNADNHCRCIWRMWSLPMSRKTTFGSTRMLAF